MSPFKCAECGKGLPSLKGCWWRHYYKDIEILCPKCGIASIDFRYPSNLMSCDTMPPEVKHERERV